MIYFIQDGDEGPIKIGYSDDVAERVKSLSTSTHNKLRILLVISGEREQEVQLHDRFRLAHKKGDWFWPVNELVEFIDRYKLSITESPAKIPAHLIAPPPLDELRIYELWDQRVSLKNICLEVFGHKPSSRQMERVREILRKAGHIEHIGRPPHRRNIDEHEVCRLYDEGKSLHIICRKVLGQEAGGHQYQRIREILRKSGRTE